MSVFHITQLPSPSERKTPSTTILLSTCLSHLACYATFSMSSIENRAKKALTTSRLLSRNTQTIVSWFNKHDQIIPRKPLLSCHVFFQNAEQIVSSIYRKNASNRSSSGLN